MKRMMRYKKAKLCAVLLLGLGLTGLQAQQAIPTAGGNASGSGGTSSYSVGQLVYSSNSGSNGSLTQGVQQPYEISVIDGFDDNNSIQLFCSVYPNPTADYLILKIQNLEFIDLSYQLFDLNGKLLSSSKITNSETQIDAIDLVPGIYFVKINQNNREVKTFKIIKN